MVGGHSRADALVASSSQVMAEDNDESSSAHY